MIVCGLPILRVQAIVGYKADMRWGLGSPIISQKEMSEWMAQECERRALRVCWGQECMCLICRAWIVQARLWLPRPAGSRVLLPSFLILRVLYPAVCSGNTFSTLYDTCFSPKDCWCSGIGLHPPYQKDCFQRRESFVPCQFWLYVLLAPTQPAVSFFVISVISHGEAKSAITVDLSWSTLPSS